jgi:hypothetical protein
MSDIEILAFVNLYFVTHLDKTYWQGLDETTQAACSSMATDDVCAKLGIEEIDVNNLPSQKAIAEQAVYLSRNHASLTANKITTDESISGAVSESQEIIATDAGFSHRAEKFIVQALKIIADANKITGPVSITRG